MRKREREDETKVTVTDVQATQAYYPEAAATACTTVAVRHSNCLLDTPVLSSLHLVVFR